MLDNFLNFLGNILSIKHFLGWYEIFFCLAICVGIFFLGHLCCMISFSVVTALQEIFFSILPTPPPQRSNGPPLNSAFSSLLTANRGILSRIRAKYGADKTWTLLLNSFWTRNYFFWRKKNIIKFGAYTENCSTYFFGAEKTLETEICCSHLSEISRVLCVLSCLKSASVISFSVFHTVLFKLFSE